MLTKTHIAVIRAALQFFDEELGPHGINAMRPYFGNVPMGDVTSREIRQLRNFLRDCKLRYASYDPVQSQLNDVVLFQSPRAVSKPAPDLRIQVVTVLLQSRL